MGLFIEDDDYDESARMTGFNRYKQLLSFYSGHWFKLGFITFVSIIPLIIAIAFSILSSSLLVLLIASPISGAIMGPFLSGLVDSVMRGLRDDTGMRWTNYKKALRQNWIGSLIPGAILGLAIGVYSFIVFLITSDLMPAPTKGFYILLLLAVFLFLLFENLYWPQFVLFSQPLKQTLINTLLFSSKYLWKVLFIIAIEIVYLFLLTIFAPISLILLPFLGIWYPIFLLNYSLYEKLNLELGIEDKFHEMNASSS